jgi:oxygen-dependent protoporphyrinogen oxidase
MQTVLRNTQNAVDVAIVGGGIAGLAAAYYLQEKARQAGLPLSYSLIERAPSFGGKIVTDAQDGFVVEGGPDSFITQKPAALRLCRELGLDGRLIGTNDAQRKVYVLDGGRLRPLPDGVMLVVPTRFTPFALSPLISVPGKLRMGLDLLIPPRRDDGDESLADFIRRRLGREALEKIAEPLMAGIHVADAERLSLQATFPRFIQLEQKYGSLIKGMLAQKARAAQAQNGTGRKQSVFMTMRGGLNELVQGLLARLQGELLPGAHVVELTRSAGPGYHLRMADGRSLFAAAVILATPAYAAADLVGPMHPRLATELRAIRYVSTATLSLGFRRAEFEHPLDGFGFVVAARDKSRLMACTWTSTKFEGRAPGANVLLRCFLGGPRNQALVDLPDAELVRLARDELRGIMSVKAEPVLARLYRWPQANPQYDVGHLERVGHIESLATDLPGLYLTGSAYRGVGIPDCIEQGQVTAQAVATALAKIQVARHS